VQQSLALFAFIIHSDQVLIVFFVSSSLETHVSSELHKRRWRIPVNSKSRLQGVRKHDKQHDVQFASCRLQLLDVQHRIFLLFPIHLFRLCSLNRL
jgi:hypothetical protein